MSNTANYPGGRREGRKLIEERRVYRPAGQEEQIQTLAETTTDIHNHEHTRMEDEGGIPQ